MTNENIADPENHGSNQVAGGLTNQVAPLAEMSILKVGTTALVEIIGEIDRSNADALGVAVSEGTQGAQRVVIDLSVVGYLDSAALTMLQTVALRGTPTDLIAPGGSRARRLLDIAGVDLALRVFETIAQADI
jgi:anti-anti-sigma factor